MSKIDDMIQEMCPDGVEYKTLKELCEKISTGKSNRADEDDSGEYPLYVRSKNILHSKTFQFDDTEAIIVPGEGGIGDIFHYVQGKYALHQRCYRICLDTDEVRTKFLLYYMQSAFKSYILSKAYDGTVSSIRKPMVENFEIPVPPIEIQDEIVKILDTFTELEAELEAELEGRRQQYEYYRNLLLTFDKATERESDAS